jgi:hypothetical protein
MNGRAKRREGEMVMEIGKEMIKNKERGNGQEIISLNNAKGLYKMNGWKSECAMGRKC